MPNILVVGSSTTDLVVDVPGFPEPGETVIGGSYRTFAGGKGANQAVAAHNCGADVCFVGRIGADHFGDMQIRALESAGINCGYIQRDSDTPAALAMISLADTGENAIVVAPGSNHKLSPQDFEAAFPALPGIDAVLLQLEIPLETNIHIIDRCHEQGVQIILNPAPAAELPVDILKKTEYLTPNENEIAAMAGVRTDSKTELGKAGKYLVEQGVQNVIITIGSEGVLWCSNNGVKHYPGFKVNAVDTTGAGDTFNGALAYAITKGWSRDDACRFAMAAAAISVTRHGAQSSIPTRDEIDAFLRSVEHKM